MKRSVHAKRMEKMHRRHNGVPKLNLVSLMDIFTILVFFLLVNSSEVEVLESDKSIKLPDSTSEKMPDKMLIIMVSDKDILVNGQPIIATDIVINNSGEEIQALKRELDYQASKIPYKSIEEQQRGKNVSIMGDAELPYELLKKIMNTCARTEYRNISLAVNQVASDDGAVDASGGP